MVILKTENEGFKKLIPEKVIDIQLTVHELAYITSSIGKQSSLGVGHILESPIYHNINGGRDVKNLIEGRKGYNDLLYKELKEALTETKE